MAVAFVVLALSLPFQFTAAQQVYIPVNTSDPRPYCDAPAVSSEAVATTRNASANTPNYYFTPFSYTQTETVRFAKSVLPTAQPTYAPGYAVASALVPDLVTASWPNWTPAAGTNATATATSTASPTADPYGPAAYSALWEAAGLSNFTRGIYSATVEPVPVPTSELIFPPPLYFGPSDCYSVPHDFIFGATGAASQIEGAVADEGRTPTVPDFLAELASLYPVQTYTTATDFVAAENYYLYKQDIERMASIGLRYYAFSIAWARILPFTFPGTPVNSQALQHYDDLINFVLEKGMIPIVTLTHFDTPAPFIGGNFLGLTERAYFGQINFGYQNDTFEDAMVNYGQIVMTHYADRVPIWITFNEPGAGCISGPAVDHVIKAHARLSHFYHDALNGTGKVSLKTGNTPGMPLDPNNATDVAAAKHYTDLYLAAWLNPLALGIDYPDAFKATIQDYVPLTAEDLEYINGTLGKYSLSRAIMSII